MVRAAWIGLAANTVVMALAGLVLGAAPDVVAGFYSTDPLVIATAAPLILLVAATMIGDGGQRVLAQSLRACHDAWFPTALHIVSYAAIMVPLGWILAFPHKLGTVGLLTAIVIASFTALTVLALRFRRVAGALRTRWGAEVVSATGRVASAALSTPSRIGAAPQDRRSCP
jgi:MATE family multidrug resistance protein